MTEFRGLYNKFNRGEIDPKAMARDDVKKVQNAGALCENFMPIRLGGMMFRPGLGEYLGETAGASYFIPFIAATEDTASLEFTDSLLRVWVDDALVTRTAVDSTIANGAFTSNITGWTDDSGSGSSTAWETGGYARLTGEDTTKAVLYQTISDTEADVEHAIRLVIVRAPVTLRLGTSGNGSNDIYEGELTPGTHSLVFTPSSNVTITISNSKSYSALVDSIAFEGAGVTTLPTDVSAAYLSTIRTAQSADIVFCSQGNGAQFQVERRGIKSWSVVDYRVDDGPFGVINISEITLTASSLSGDVNLTASDDYFTSSDVGVLFKLGSVRQKVKASISAEDSGTGSVRVTGVGDTREFTISITGVWVAVVTLQRSADDASWEDVQTYSVNTGIAYDDELDNSELYYRLWVKSRDWTSGTVKMKISYDSGSIDGICRVISYTSATVVAVQVLQNFGSKTATRYWYRGAWSSKSGYPTSVSLSDGRLWWAGRAKMSGSVSDAFTSFDSELEGDSKAISKTIGFGPVDDILWLADGDHLMMGLSSALITVRSSDYNEALVQNNVNLRKGASEGAGAFDPVDAGDSLLYVGRSRTKLFDLGHTVTVASHKYQPKDLCMLNPGICSAGIKRVVVSMQPEKRVFCVMDDGEVRVFLLEKSEDIEAWSRITTDGDIEDALVLPGLFEDQVYFVVNRTGGRYFEKMARFGDAIGASMSRHFDSFVSYTSPGTTITGLDHLEGETVSVWGDGQDRGTQTVSSGQITVSGSWTNVCVGLAHTDNWKSAKIGGFLPNKASVLGINSRIFDTTLILENVLPSGISIGPTSDLLKSMPLIEAGTDFDHDTVHAEYCEVPFEFSGITEIDPRIYIRATGPVTVLAVSYGVDISINTPSD